MKVVKIKLSGYGHYYEKADNLQAITGMVESHIRDSDPTPFGSILCLIIENMDESKFESLPEFMGF